MYSEVLFYLQLSPGGILDEETVGRGLSNLGRSADGTMQVYLHATIAVRLYFSFHYIDKLHNIMQ